MKLALKPLNDFLRFVPDSIHTHLISHLGGHFMQNQSITSRLDFMQGKRLKFTITDTNNCWQFIIKNNHLLSDNKSNLVADVHIQGSLKTFLLLASGLEDPDSLFFARELSLEGNTEDGLYIKNIIDAMDFDMHVYLKSILGASLASSIFPLVDKLNLNQYFHTLSKKLLVKY